MRMVSQSSKHRAAPSQTQQWQIVPVHISASSTPAFLLTANPPTVTIVQGSKGSSVITFSPSGGYSGSATLACAGLPTNATCTFSPSTITLDGKDTVQTTTLTITTQGASAVPPVPSGRLPNASIRKLSTSCPVSVLGSLFCRINESSRRARVRVLTLVASVACILAIASCGGGSSVTPPPPPPPPTPTPVGSALITVTANATATAGSAKRQLDAECRHSDRRHTSRRPGGRGEIGRVCLAILCIFRAILLLSDLYVCSSGLRCTQSIRVSAVPNSSAVNRYVPGAVACHR